MKMPTDVIREEIKKMGVIPFARFMELALYCPETGYYERNRDNVGRRGDFITSVSTGSLFGELLAFQFAEWLQEMRSAPVSAALRRGKDCELRIVEAGAHDGKLAGDILHWLQKFRPELFAQIEYCILEPSPARRHWQQQRLKDFGNVHWIDQHPSTLSFQLTGILFSNELLDAFPVRRFGWDAAAKRWFEWGVTLAGDTFAWHRSADSLSASALLESQLADKLSALLDVLPDGYILEDSPAAESWWRSAADSLKRGKLLAIDYGYKAEEQFSPARLKGTLRAYHRHQVSDDLLARPGEQDLTAHVNFSAIQATGEKAGLKTDAFCSQPQLLTRIFSRAVKEKAFAGLDAKQVRQFQTLTHPDHLGRAFRVLVQSR